MKLFLTKTILFVMSIVIPIILISRFDNLDKNTSSNDQIIKLRCISLFDSLDVLFIGNSYTYSGINIQMLDSINLRAFNLGIAAAGPFFYELIIDEYLKNVSSKPKVIFFLVSPMSFTSMADNFEAYPIHRYLEEPYSNEYISFKYYNFNNYISLQKKSFNKGLVQILNSTFKRNKNNFYDCDDQVPLKGFFPSITINDLKSVQDTEYLYQPLIYDSFDYKKAECLQKIADRLINMGIEIKFYSLPTNLLKNYLNDLYLADYAKYTDMLKKKYEFISIDLPMYNMYFRNIDHLNSYGATLVTKELIKKLNKKSISINDTDNY